MPFPRLRTNLLRLLLFPHPSLVTYYALVYANKTLKPRARSGSIPTSWVRACHPAPRPPLPTLESWRSRSWSLKRDALREVATWGVTEAISARGAPSVTPLFAIDWSSIPSPNSNSAAVAESWSMKMPPSTPRGTQIFPPRIRWEGCHTSGR